MTDALSADSLPSWSVLWWPFVMSCVSGLSTVLGAVLVLLRARLTNAPLSSAHLAFTSGLACSVMVVVSVSQMLLPASFTSSHRIGPLAALSICAASAALSVLAIRQAPIDRLLAAVGLSSAALLQPATAASPPSTPPITPSSHGSAASSATSIPTALSRPSSPSRYSATTAAEQLRAAYTNSVPPFLQRAISSAGSSSAADGRVDGDDSGGGSSGSGGRDEVRLLVAGSASNGKAAAAQQYSYALPPSLRWSASSPSSLSTLRLGVLTALLLAFHNLPEGLAVFVSSFDDQQAGLGMALALSAHNIPEVSSTALRQAAGGLTCPRSLSPHIPHWPRCLRLCAAVPVQGLIIATPIYASTRSVWLTVLWTGASGVTEPLGALLALTVLRPYLTHRLMQQLLCVVAGIMLSVSAVELYPSAVSYKQPKAMQAGLICGGVLIFGTSAITAAIW